MDRDDNLHDLHDSLISGEALCESLDGVATATSAHTEDKLRVSKWLLSCISDAVNPSFGRWLAAIPNAFPKKDENARQLAIIVLVITFVRMSCRERRHIEPIELDRLWSLIHAAISNAGLGRSLGNTSNSAKGLFLIVPLYSSVKDGYIDQLIRLHVWLPGHPRPIPEFAIHAHQCFAQSWILAGTGTDYSYVAEAVKEPAVATHAEYSNEWSKGKGYQADTKRANIWNTGDLVQVKETHVAAHSRDMTYSIPAGAYHMSEVHPDVLHSTLFFFDSRRGFVKDARVLGPKDGELFSHTREPTLSHQLTDASRVAPGRLVDLVASIRSWERLMEEGGLHQKTGNQPQALQTFNKALQICESTAELPHSGHYKVEALAAIANCR